MYSLFQLIEIIEEEGSLRKAAARIGVSHQSISKRFARLDRGSDLWKRYQAVCGRVGRKKSPVPLKKRLSINSQNYYKRQKALFKREVHE